jgi:hypothetical protein
LYRFLSRSSSLSDPTDRLLLEELNGLPSSASIGNGSALRFALTLAFARPSVRNGDGAGNSVAAGFCFLFGVPRGDGKKLPAALVGDENGDSPVSEKPRFVSLPFPFLPAVSTANVSFRCFLSVLSVSLSFPFPPRGDIVGNALVVGRTCLSCLFTLPFALGETSTDDDEVTLSFDSGFGFACAVAGASSTRAFGTGRGLGRS